MLSTAGSGAIRIAFGAPERPLAIVAAPARLQPHGFAIEFPGREAPRLSIVVLPFANLSNDPEQEYFADGITDDLTTDLTRTSGRDSSLR